MSIVFFDGHFVPRTQALLPIDDRGFLFGDGVFTSMKVCDGRLELYHAHLSRLRANALALKIEPPHIDISWLQELLRLNQAQKGIWKLKIIITGGQTDLRAIKPRLHGHMLILIERQSINQSEACRLTQYPHAISGPTANLKSLSYLNRLLIADYANGQNCYDALVLSPEGWILETAFANTFWRVGNEIFTPDEALPLLAGVSLGAVKKCVQKLGMHWLPVKAEPHSLPSDAQLFLTNAMIGIMPVESYMDRQLERDLIFEDRLRESYSIVVEAETAILFT